MKKCSHENYVEFFPAECHIHRNLMPGNETYKTTTIKIKICMDCKQILEVKDFGE
jgi:hypothetical protein